MNNRVTLNSQTAQRTPLRMNGKTSQRTSMKLDEHLNDAVESSLLTAISILRDDFLIFFWHSRLGHNEQIQ